MERIDPKTVLPLIKAEHTHRYLWAARGSRGHVLDAACGVGYGAPILMNGPLVTDYTGLDCSTEAVDYAKREFAGIRRTFVKGDVYSLPFADGTFDSIVSLETIEHLEDPTRALAEFARVLKPDGVLLGSVPQKEFEDLCTAAYGPNEYHKSQFDYAGLVKFIQGTFKNYSIWKCWLAISSVVAPADLTDRRVELELEADWGGRLGSLLFAATQGNREILPPGPITKILPATGLTEHERATLTWRDKAIAKQAKMIDERDALILATEARVEARKVENEAQARLVDARDQAIREDAVRLENRAREIAKQASIIQERDSTIAKQIAQIEECNSKLAAATKLVDEQRLIVAAKEEGLSRLHNELVEVKALQESTGAQLESLQAEFAISRDQLSAVRMELAEWQSKYSKSESELASLQGERDSLSVKLNAATARLAEHELLVKSQSDLIVKRAEFIKHLETLIIERDKAIINMTKMIDARTELIRNQDLIVASRDAKIQSQSQLLEERNRLVAQQAISISSLEMQLGDAQAFAGSLQLSLREHTHRIGMLEARIASLGGSLSMVRNELRHHLSDLRRPVFCVRQATRAILGLAKFDGASSREGQV